MIYSTQHVNFKARSPSLTLKKYGHASDFNSAGNPSERHVRTAAHSKGTVLERLAKSPPEDREQRVSCVLLCAVHAQPGVRGLGALELHAERTSALLLVQRCCAHETVSRGSRGLRCWSQRPQATADAGTHATTIPSSAPYPGWSKGYHYDPDRRHAP